MASRACIARSAGGGHRSQCIKSILRSSKRQHSYSCITHLSVSAEEIQSNSKRVWSDVGQGFGQMFNDKKEKQENVESVIE